jgi:hypothetical protein
VVVTRGRQEEIIEIHLPSSTELCLRSGGQWLSQDAWKLDIPLKPNSLFTESNVHSNSSVKTSEFNRTKT